MRPLLLFPLLLGQAATCGGPWRPPPKVFCAEDGFDGRNTWTLVCEEARYATVQKWEARQAAYSRAEWLCDGPLEIRESDLPPAAVLLAIKIRRHYFDATCLSPVQGCRSDIQCNRQGERCVSGECVDPYAR